MPAAATTIGTVCVPNSIHNDWLSRAELDALTPDILVERMRALAPLVADHALEAERIRRPVDDVWAAIRKTGILYHFVPKKYGGLEFDLDTFIDAVLPVGEGCASTAWVTAFCMEHNWILGQFPEEAQDEVFGQFPYITAPGTLYPPGVASNVEGGYILNGRWKWGTGIMHSDWVLVGGAVPSDGPPDLHFFLMPISDVTVIDTWQVDGMVATGSNDIVIKDLFVPAHRTLRISALRSGEAFGPKLHDSWLFRLPMSVLLAMTAVIASVGAARSTVRLFSERLAAGDIKLTEKPAAQMRLAAAKLETTMAERLLREVGARATELAQHEGPASLAARVEMRAHICYSADLCREAIRKISDIAGSSAHGLGNPIQRAMRDVGVICSHALLDMDSMKEAYGRSLIGLAPNSMLDGN